MRRFAPIVLVCLLAATATSCDPPSGTVAGTLVNDGTTSRVIQYNVQGSNSSFDGFNGNTTSSILASLQARTPKPAAISFNEICWNQWVDLWNQYFGLNGYVAEAQWAATSPYFAGLGSSAVGSPIGGSSPTRYYSRLSSSCSAFGNVTAVLGTSAIRSIKYFDRQNASNIAGNNFEYKGAVCVISNLYAMSPCSAHLTAASPSDAIVQQWEYSVFVNPMAVQNIPMYVMGDFNLRHSQNSGGFDSWWYAYFAEADERSGRYRTSKMRTTDGPNQNDGLPIDFIFRRTPTSYPYEPYIFQTSWSDHHWYEAFL